MKYLVAWRQTGTGNVGKGRVRFASKELAEVTVRTLGRLQPEREFWVEIEGEGLSEGVYLAVGKARGPHRHRKQPAAAPEPPMRRTSVGTLELPANSMQYVVPDQVN